MATKPYVKLDLDWRSDEKVARLELEYGRPYLLDWICIMTLMSKYDGTLNMNDKVHESDARATLRKSAANVRKSLDMFASVGLIDKDLWRIKSKACSERSLKDAAAKQARRDYAIGASEAAAEKRRAAREGGNRDGYRDGDHYGHRDGHRDG